MPGSIRITLKKRPARSGPHRYEDAVTQPKGYSLAQIRLHWIVAALIAAQYVFKGPIEEAWSAFRDGAEIAFNPLIFAHVVGGMLVLLFALWRLTLRKTRGAPPPPEAEAKPLKIAAHITHWTLYALMIGMPISGGLAWFGGVEQAAFAHNVLKVPLLILAILHVLAALFHQFVLKTNLIARMKRAEV
ncbi:cytochrome b/b6 domain-containing protein [Aliiroseovarius sp. KMU-50]|uniref:Cytochrome b/b6 domain-containing protein n=1 Tax=Aliiroseovarius salicola TaxID=3009082 RepID=A0ABT4W499_9RHOB|nr:cytochrome b/b6 domain-containing protein [Aliiroseovarius sp. KMU-50]MDA5095339.1 cytochrome b/b6 domain-containing protein [Aliiroseovarius sp. KMU-50]